LSGIKFASDLSDTDARHVHYSQFQSERDTWQWSQTRGRRHWRLLDGRSFNLILMEVEIPALNGFQATAAKRAGEIRRLREWRNQVPTGLGITDITVEKFQQGNSSRENHSHIFHDAQTRPKDEGCQEDVGGIPK
jgi:hypothetical protein